VLSVFACQGTPTRRSSYLQTVAWPQASVLPVGSESPPDSYKVALQFKKLYLLTAFWPDPRVHYRCLPSHFPVWPIADPTLQTWTSVIHESDKSNPWSDLPLKSGYSILQ